MLDRNVGCKNYKWNGIFPLSSAKELINVLHLEPNGDLVAIDISHVHCAVSWIQLVFATIVYSIWIIRHTFFFTSKRSTQCAWCVFVICEGKSSSWLYNSFFQNVLCVPFWDRRCLSKTLCPEFGRFKNYEVQIYLIRWNCTLLYIYRFFLKYKY